MTEYGSGRQWALIAVVRVDVEAEDGVHFYRLLAAHGGTEFPIGQGLHDLGRHCGRAGLKHLQISQIAGCVESALYYDAGARKIRREIGAHALRADQRACQACRWAHFGELHYCRAEIRIHVNCVVVAGELAVEVKGAAGARSGDDCDRRAFFAFD